MDYKQRSEEAIIYFNNYWKLNKIDTSLPIANIIDSRQNVAQIQSFLSSRKFYSATIDGLWGPSIDWAYEAFKEKVKTGKVVPFRTDTVNNVPHLKTIYPRYKDIESYYGKMSDISSNIISIKPAYKHHLAWSPRQSPKTIQCHKKIADVYSTILEEVLKAYGIENIHKLGLDLFGGSFASPPRKMRGGTEWSTHCYGIAFDYNPEANQLKWGNDKAVFAKPEYADFMDIWASKGAINIGECKGYDYMHFQLSSF